MNVLFFPLTDAVLTLFTGAPTIHSARPRATEESRLSSAGESHTSQVRDPCLAFKAQGPAGATDAT